MSAGESTPDGDMIYLWVPVEAWLSRIEEAIGLIESLEEKRGVTEVRYKGYRTGDGNIRIKMVVGIAFQVGTDLRQAEFIAGLGILYYGMWGLNIKQWELGRTEDMYRWVDASGLGFALGGLNEEIIGSGTIGSGGLEEFRRRYDDWIGNETNRWDLVRLIEAMWNGVEYRDDIV